MEEIKYIMRGIVFLIIIGVSLLGIHNSQASNSNSSCNKHLCKKQCHEE